MEIKITIPSMDAVRALLFPLHITAFCLCDSLAEDSYLGASQVIVVSASSKTAIGLAQGLADTENAPKIVGLTSPIKLTVCGKPWLL